MGSTVTNTMTQSAIKYTHHHFFICALNRCHIVGFGVAAPVAVAAFASESELCSISDFDMIERSGSYLAFLASCQALLKFRLAAEVNGNSECGLGQGLQRDRFPFYRGRRAQSGC